MTTRLMADTKIAAACSSIPIAHWATSSVLVVPRDDETCFAVATDCKCLSAVILRGTVDRPSLLPGKLPRSKKHDILFDGKEWRHQDRFAAAQSGWFPGIGPVLPKAPGTKVKIDVKLLARVAQAISRDGAVTLFVGEPNEAVAVLGACGIGVVMPRLGGEVRDDSSDYERRRQELSAALPYKVNIEL